MLGLLRQHVVAALLQAAPRDVRHALDEPLLGQPVGFVFICMFVCCVIFAMSADCLFAYCLLFCLASLGAESYPVASPRRHVRVELRVGGDVRLGDIFKQTCNTSAPQGV